MMSTNQIVIGVTVPETFSIIGEFPEYLRENGWTVTLLSSPGRHLDDLEQRGFAVERVKMNRDPTPVADLRALFESIRVLRRYRKAVLLVGTPKASLILLTAAKLLRMPVRIYEVKGLRYEGEAGRKRALYRAIESVSMALSNRVIAISPSIKDVILAEGLTKPTKVDILGPGADHGVDTEFFSASRPTAQVQDFRKRLGIPEGHTVVGYVGRINRDKGLAELAEVARRSYARDNRITFVIVGPDESEDFQPFSTASSNVVRVGWVDDPRPYFEAFDIFCLPTYREGLPNVNLQASAMELPVVTTSATGAVDTVVHNRTGIIVAPRSATALETAILKLYNDQPLANRLGANGRNWVKTKYDSRTVWKARLLWLNQFADFADL